jgi:hypothetical protein
MNRTPVSSLQEKSPATKRTGHLVGKQGIEPRS